MKKGQNSKCVQNVAIKSKKPLALLLIMPYNTPMSNPKDYDEELTLEPKGSKSMPIRYRL